jgi:CRISPR/Cas system-associated protein Cas10 (large subunit of type III CRISPR-Cas system)
MNLQDVVAIASFAIAILGIVYGFGTMAERLAATKRDVDGLGKKVEKFDTRIDKISTFCARIDQRVAHLQEEILGCERTERLRESDPDTPYFSPNSGIEL